MGGRETQGEDAVEQGLRIHFVSKHETPPETRHALSLQQLRALVQPAFVFDENVPAKIPVQTPLRQAKPPIHVRLQP